MNQCHHRVASPQRNQHVADREATAPDRIDHGVIGACGGIGAGDFRIGAEMAGQLERQLHARRILCKPLVDAELEEERAILVAQHDAGGHRRCAGAQADDLALTGFGECGRGTANESGIAGVLDQRGAALAFPAARFEPQEGFEHCPDALRRASNVERDRAMLFEPVLLAPKLLELLGPEGFPQHRFAVPRRIEARVTSGNIKLDFTDAVIAHTAIEIEAEVRSGNLIIITKPGIAVDTDDVVIRSGNVRVKAPWGSQAPVTVQISVSGKVGSGNIVARPPRRSFWDWRRLRRVVRRARV